MVSKRILEVALEGRPKIKGPGDLEGMCGEHQGMP